MKFLVDAPLGGLARWLRFCGFDATLRPLPARGDLPEPQPGQYLLTLQKSLQKPGREDIVILSAVTPEAQLEEVLQRLTLTRRDLNPMSRCVKCNETLAPVPREAAAGRVPEHVFHTQKEFYECPACRHLYWPGSHVAGISRKIFQALGRKRPKQGDTTPHQQRNSP